MNCIECRELLPAYADGSLAQEPSFRTCEEHLALCPSCRAALESLRELDRALAARGAAAAHASVVAPVLRRITDRSAAKTERPLGRLFLRWGLGLGAAAAAIAVLTLAVFSPRTNAQAVDVMQRGIVTANALTTVHVQGLMRTPPADNFSRVDAGSAPVTVELWREFGGAKRWRVEKPGRVAAMDGTVTALFIRPDLAMKLDRPSQGAFDTGWLQRIADIEQLLTVALANAKAKGWQMDLAHVAGAGGKIDAIVTIATPGGSSRDYLANKFIDSSKLQQVYRFDDASGRLEALQIVLCGTTNTVVFETTRIEYNQPIAAEVFTIALPANVTWRDTTPKPLPPKYAGLTADAAARMFFEACGREDWDEAGVFIRFPLTDRVKGALGGLKLRSLGEPFSSTFNAAKFVPYEIELRGGQVKKHNLALKQDPKSGGWYVDGGI